MLIIGIDPGNDGAIARVSFDGGQPALLEVTRFAKTDSLLALNEAAIPGSIWAVEAPLAHFRGQRAAFMAGQFNGLIRGVASASGIEYRPYLPVQWRKWLGTPSTLDREGLKRWAKEYSGLKHDGAAEAYCIAVACYRHFRSLQPNDEPALVSA